MSRGAAEQRVVRRRPLRAAAPRRGSGFRRAPGWAQAMVASALTRCKLEGEFRVAVTQADVDALSSDDHCPLLVIAGQEHEDKFIIVSCPVERILVAGYAKVVAHTVSLSEIFACDHAVVNLEESLDGHCLVSARDASLIDIHRGAEVTVRAAERASVMSYSDKASLALSGSARAIGPNAKTIDADEQATVTVNHIEGLLNLDGNAHVHRLMTMGDTGEIVVADGANPTFGTVMLSLPLRLPDGRRTTVGGRKL